ncbi:hypothetical protein LSM04_008892 [Trypanosoma melophagium]|uniref:uncharacterized protein n=1 Tax=Trypanosoma melophagium TaxID=715481 RepID=UPI003519E7F9|nr:hypothetical protein LSM04_008892 [Trypanosoma melophagium]
MGYLTSVLDCCADVNICCDVRFCTSCQIGRRERLFPPPAVSSCFLTVCCLLCGLCETGGELTLRQSTPGGTYCDPTLCSVENDGYDRGFVAPHVLTLV